MPTHVSNNSGGLRKQRLPSKRDTPDSPPTRELRQGRYRAEITGNHSIEDVVVARGCGSFLQSFFLA